MKLFNIKLIILIVGLLFGSCLEEDIARNSTRTVSKTSLDFLYSNTKVADPQTVSSANIYTLYSYTSASIRDQFVQVGKWNFDVPSDDNDYCIFFLAKSLNSLTPERFDIPNENKNEIKKTLIYKSTFNENLCYAIFTNGNMPKQKDVEVIFIPVFSQLELILPAKVENNDLLIKNITLLSGVQETADVIFSKNTDNVSNKKVNYSMSKTNFTKELEVEKITANEWGFKGKYYNLIPNSNPFKISVTLELKGKEITKEIGLPNNTKLSNGTRYRLSIINQISTEIELSIFSISSSNGIVDGGSAF
jgi:hypothetical protein